MQARRRLVKGIIFLCVLLLVGLPRNIVMAGEQIGEGETVEIEGLEVLKTGEEQAEEITIVMLKKAIKIVPYIGVVLFVIGIFTAVFSTRNKGNRRWGIRMAVIESVITYGLYIAMILLYDFFFQDKAVGLLGNPEEMTVYGNVYYSTLERLKNDGQRFVFLEKGWQDDFVVAVRRMYMSIVWILSFTSIGVGTLLLVVTKRERGFRRFAFAGMCIAIPAALIVGYQFLKM